MAINSKDFEKKLNQLAWYNNGSIDFSKYPIEHPAKDCCSHDEEKFRNAVNILMEMTAAGRKDAMLMLFGLFEYYKNDYKKLEVIVYNMPEIDNEIFVNFLFDFFEKTESNNTTRFFLKQMLHKLKFMNREIAIRRFHRLLENPKYSYRMKKKFKEILERISPS